MNKHGIESVDFIKEIMNMTKAEQLVIKTIRERLDWDSKDGVTYIPLTRVLGKTKAVVFQKGFKLLKDKGLVRRVKISHYMINPKALIPLDYSLAEEVWFSLEEGEIH